MSDNIEKGKGLSPYISAIGAFALAIGTTLGWGSLVDTGNIYLLLAGPVGTMLGIAMRKKYQMLGKLTWLPSRRTKTFRLGSKHGPLFLGLRGNYLNLFWETPYSVALRINGKHNYD